MVDHNLLLKTNIIFEVVKVYSFKVVGFPNNGNGLFVYRIIMILRNLPKEPNILLLEPIRVIYSSILVLVRTLYAENTLLFSLLINILLTYSG